MKKIIIIISLLLLGVSLILIGGAYQNKLEVERKDKLAKEKALLENETKKKIKEAYHETIIISKETKQSLTKRNHLLKQQICFV